MARLSIEDRWWSDPRRIELGSLVGGNIYLADGIMVNLWRLAQEYWKQDESLIPINIFKKLKFHKEVLEIGLAEEKPMTNESKRNPSEAWIPLGIYISGTRENSDWLLNFKKLGSIGGKKSAQRPRDKLGRLLKTGENSKGQPSEIQASLGETPSLSNPLPLPLPLPKKKKNTYGGIRTEYPPCFNSLWEGYERKGEKKAAFTEYEKLNLSSQDKATLTEAITQYKRKNPDKKYRKDFERFLKTDWREFTLADKRGTSEKIISSDEEWEMSIAEKLKEIESEGQI